MLSELGIDGIHKRKRDIGNILHPKYRSLIDIGLVGYNSVEPNVSAERLIRDCEFVISMPFTSTALIGKHAGKPSIYYDPFGDVLKGDRAAHGIKIVVGIDDLRSWLSEITQTMAV